ncbi:MAG: molecular chaperone DnaJ [Homoserinimonas sp.]|nr:molecular chaperone DnaJ [Homoserinimonas sp.]
MAPTASAEDLRRAYRQRARETHPDTGGDATGFHAVQHAWEILGTPEGRAAYDRGSMAEASHPTWATAPPRRRQDTRPAARSYGHPGGWRREKYLKLIREWAGRGALVTDPYDPALVRSAPRDIRHLLADALAEEATASQLSTLGIGYTLWHDVATEAADGGPENKLDHVVLGPTGLFAILSEDWGGHVKVRRGELIGDVLAPGERPFQGLALRARSVARAARVKFTAIAIVVPDDASDEGIMFLGRMRGMHAVLVQRSRLPGLLRNGLPDLPPIGGTELFEVRTRLQGAVRFV